MLSNVRNDIRYALRTLRRNPGFALAAIVPIALGIGINTALFSLLNSVAWRPLPVPDPEALVSVYQDFRGGPRRTVHGARSLLSIPEYRAYRDEAHTLTGLMAYSREWTVTLGRESAQEIGGILVTCNYFDVLGVSPAHRHRLHVCQLRHAGRAAGRRVESRALAERLRQRSADPRQAGCA